MVGDMEPETDLIDVFAACARELQKLTPEHRGRVLRALVELYRSDFETKPVAIGSFSQQLQGLVDHRIGPTKYGS